MVLGLTDELAALGLEVIKEESLTNFYENGDETFVSADRQGTFIALSMAGDFDDATDNIDSVIEVADGAKGQGDFEVLTTGVATVSNDFQEIAERDLVTGEAFGVPIAFIILVAVFRALVAAFVPIVLAIISIAVAMAAAAVTGQVFQLHFFVQNMITMIGLAVGIDYSLFIVARYREERARGSEKLEAIARSGSTATRAVFFSGLTAVLALIGMVLIPSSVFIALGIGAIFVVIASMLASMTLLPAVLSLLGDRVNKLSVPFIGRTQARFDETKAGGFWDGLSRAVMRQPVLSVLVVGGLLVALSIPVFDLNAGSAGISTVPDRLESNQAFLILDEDFSAGEVTPAEIIIDDIDSPAVQAGIDRLVASLATDEDFSEPSPLDVNDVGDLALLTVPSVRRFRRGRGAGCYSTSTQSAYPGSL